MLSKVRHSGGVAALLIVSTATLLADFSASSVRAGAPQQETAVRAAPATEHPLDPALRIARQSLRHIHADIADYTVLIVKRERVNGTLSDFQYLRAKIRNRKVKGERTLVPFSVYLKFLKPNSVKGREVIWVEGQNNGKLIAHEGGFKNLFRVQLPPNGLMAMMGQRYPITNIGFEHLAAELIRKGDRDRQRGECNVQFFREAKVFERVCTRIVVTHPVPRPYFDFSRAEIFLDDELNVPIRYAAWTWPQQAGGEPLLLEEYTYTKLELNVGLTNKDFDPDNSRYNFP